MIGRVFTAWGELVEVVGTEQGKERWMKVSGMSNVFVLKCINRTVSSRSEWDVFKKGNKPTHKVQRNIRN